MRAAAAQPMASAGAAAVALDIRRTTRQHYSAEDRKVIPSRLITAYSEQLFGSTLSPSDASASPMPALLRQRIY